MSSLPRGNATTLGNLFRALALVASGLALTGCPGELDPALLPGGGGGSGGGGTGGGTVCAGDAILKSSTCAVAGCHGVNAPSGGLDLFSDGLVTRLLGKAPNPATTQLCSGGMQYLVPDSNPATGLILDKLNPLPSCGGTMPSPLGNLPADQKQCLQEWATAVTTGRITQ
jgi:hypothetical protein